MPATTTISKVQAPGLSLLPYLQPSATRLWLRVPGPASHQGISPTFEESILKIGPVVDLIPVELMFDHRQVISRHHLLMQADHYRFSDVDPTGVNNPAVASLWSRFVESHMPNGANDVSDEHAVIQFPLDPDNGASICRPLFFCGFRHLFCHPICPYCGNGLTLCCDDEWLISNHLPAYGGSMARFLYCPQCVADDGTSAFYTPSPIHLEATVGGGNNVFSIQDLVYAWGDLIQSEKALDFLPCQGCDEAQLCFGSSKRVTERMSAFRFFPFYMMLQPASLIPTDDYMALLSGSALASFRPPATDKTDLPIVEPIVNVAPEPVNHSVNGTARGAENGEKAAIAGKDGASDHRQIRTILADILATWPEDQTDEVADVAENALDNTVAEIPQTDNGSLDDHKNGDVEETVVLTSSADQRPAPVSAAEDTDAFRTVVVSPTASEGAAADPPRPVMAESDLEKTVALSPSGGHTPPIVSDVSEADEQFDKTVALPGAVNTAKGDDLDQTVIVSPGSSPEPPADIAQDDAALDATVVLRPADQKKGKPSS